MGRLVELLHHRSTDVQIPAMYAISEIVTDNTTDAQLALAAGACNGLRNLLQSGTKLCRKEVCWALTNIAEGTSEQVQHLFESALIDDVVELLRCTDFDIKREAAWVIHNVTSSKDIVSVEYLIRRGCVRCLVDLLSTCDAGLLLVALQTLGNMLDCGRQLQISYRTAENLVATLVEEADGVERLEKMQESANDNIYNRSARILRLYFLDDDCDNSSAMDTGFAVTEAHTPPQWCFSC